MAATRNSNKGPDRNINPQQVSRLAHGQWCHLGQNIVILGKSSVGKTYLAQALITAACRNDYSARFYRTDMLAAELAVLQPDDPKRLKFIQHLHDVDVLVLDDFLTTPVDAATAHHLLNILAGREGKVSTIVTSQFILRLPSFSGHPICTDLVSVREDVHCESTAQEVHAGVPA